MLTLDRLEDRIVPSTLTVDAGDVNNPTPQNGYYSLVGAIAKANTDSSNGIADTISLTNGTYNFTSVNNTTTNGANLLPLITATNLTIQGNGSTLNGASLGRIFDVSSGAGLTLENLTLTGGEASGANAQGGAIFNSGGNVTLNTVVAGGNQVTASTGQNAQGGAIYSNGGTLTLSKDIIGQKVTDSYNSKDTLTNHATLGAANKATGGTAQGAGLYVSGGTVKISNCTFAVNSATGGAGDNAQGGGLYSNGATLDLSKDLIGGKVIKSINSTTHSTTKHTSIGGPNRVLGGIGADAQGAGLYVSGGTVKVTNCTVSDNSARGATGIAGVAGGSAQGGGMYAAGATLTITGGSIDANFVSGGYGGAGTNKSANGFTGRLGGSAQGGGIYANNVILTLSGGSVSSDGGFAGIGGTGAAGTTNHVTGGAGGANGISQGGGIFAQGGSLTITNGAKVSTNSLNISIGGNGGSGFTKGGITGKGGNGGAGGNAQGGGVYADQTPVLIEDGAQLNSNTITAGAGGSGGNGANGGAGGSAQGGGLFALDDTVSIESNAQVEVNTANGGTGGYAGNGVAGDLAGGNGGNGGAVDGGGVFASGGNVTITSATITVNDIYDGDAGAGGAGGTNAVMSGVGGAGGAGGNLSGGAGGGLYVAGTNLAINISNVNLSFNNVNAGNSAGHGGAGGNAMGVKGQGGAGGPGGDTETVSGAGAAIFGDNTVTLNGVTVDHNSAAGGNGGTGGAGGAGTTKSGIGGAGGLGGYGGVTQGGGLFVSSGTLNISGGSSFEHNISQSASGGVGGVHGAPLLTSVTNANGGNGGEALGGGVAFTGTSVTLDAVAISNNLVSAGEGGEGGGVPNTANTTGHRGNGGNGGNGSPALGGGLYAANSALTIQDGTTITTNAVFGALGGPGGGADNNAGYSYGIRGTPGTVQGGGMAISNMTSPVSFINSTIDSNLLDYGVGYSVNGYNNSKPFLDINGGNGLTGGIGQGAGLFVLGSTFNATNGFFTNNVLAINNGSNGNSPTKSAQQYTGGNGGNGGIGGTAQGGGVYATSSTLTLNSSTLSGNTLSVDNGGVAGIGFHGKNKTGVSVAAPNGVVGNGGSGGNGQGAGLYASGSSGVTLLDTSVSGNTINIDLGGNGVSPGNAEAGGYGGTGGSNGNGQGGGVYANSSTTLKITNSTLADNVLNIDNGGNGGNGNVGGAGGAAAVATSKNLSPTSGTAQGGGLFAEASTLALVNDTLANNALNVANGGAGGNGSNGAGGNGGAGGTNGATGQGGGLYLTGGTISAINDTIAANSMVLELGGAGGTGTSSGTAGTSGTNFIAQAGGLYNDPTNSDSVTLENTIVALDTVFSSANDIYGTIASSDHDFIGDGSGATFTASSGDQIGSSTSPLNPDLGPLANYGGPTLTMMPINGSPVIGKGDTGALTAIATAEGTTVANTTDQRGYARSVNSLIDIGADEFQPGLSISGTATPTSVQAGGTITYTLTVTNPGQFAIDGLSLTDTLPADTTFVSLTTPSGWTSTTPTAGQTGTVAATTTSLAGGQSATFTLVVQVNASVTGGTTLLNTATVTPTQSGVQLGNASVTLSTTVGSSLVNITNEIAILKTPILRDFDDGANSYIQAMLLINKSGATITGPVALVLTGLPAGVTLTNASGTYDGSPYITLEPSNGSWKSGWWNFLLVFLEFSDTSGARITYTPEIVQGL